jgi:hypothetical protein
LVVDKEPTNAKPGIFYSYWLEVSLFKFFISSQWYHPIEVRLSLLLAKPAQRELMHPGTHGFERL